MKPANNAPVYASIYAGLAEIARAHGYALAVHGTLARDFDLIAIPWVAIPDEPMVVLRDIVFRYSVRLREEEPTTKPHGRLVWTLHFEWGDVALDIGFMPTKEAA